MGAIDHPRHPVYDAVMRPTNDRLDRIKHWTERESPDRFHQCTHGDPLWAECHRIKCDPLF